MSEVRLNDDAVQTDLSDLVQFLNEDYFNLLTDFRKFKDPDFSFGAYVVAFIQKTFDEPIVLRREELEFLKESKKEGTNWNLQAVQLYDLQTRLQQARFKSKMNSVEQFEKISPSYLFQGDVLLGISSEQHDVNVDKSSFYVNRDVPMLRGFLLACKKHSLKESDFGKKTADDVYSMVLEEYKGRAHGVFGVASKLKEPSDLVLERALVLQLGFQEAGIASKLVRGKLNLSRHLWVEANFGQNETYIYDPLLRQCVKKEFSSAGCVQNGPHIYDISEELEFKILRKRPD